MVHHAGSGYQVSRVLGREFGKDGWRVEEGKSAVCGTGQADSVLRMGRGREGCRSGWRDEAMGKSKAVDGGGEKK